MKGTIKSFTSDKYLRPIREQMIGMLDKHDRVLDLGCGTGDFLIRAHEKIEFGLGVDGSKSLINYAEQKKKELHINNIEFQSLFVDEDFQPCDGFTVATACLLYHVIPHEKAIQILQSSTKYADRIVICGFTPPQSTSQKLLMWFDQRFTSHFHHYIQYCKNGYMEGLLKKCQLTTDDITDTFDPTIKIYSIKS